MDISKSIEVCLKKKKWKQSDLAEKMGVSETAISGIKVRNTCHSQTLMGLASAFDLKVSKFIAAGEQ